MADVSGRRREPKGIPTGGEFAKEDSGAADAADLEEAAFERAEREADEYYSSLTDEELERQWAEESGRTPGPTATEGRRDSERQRAERTGSHLIPKPPAAPKGGTGPGIDSERDRLWDALAGQHAGPQTRARLAVAGIDGNARPVAAAEEKARSGRARPGAGKDGGEAKRHGAPSKPQPRHPRLIRFASTAGRVGAIVLGGFLGAVRRMLAPLGRR